MFKNSYGDFEVYNKDDKYSFVHLKINEDKFYEMLISYFFDEERLLKFITNEEDFKFIPTQKNYAKLYKNISKFIDFENQQIDMDIFFKELEKYGVTENLFSKSEILEFRRDKSGKIGEYIFSIILLEYFKMTCIIPKIQLTTDPNMSVFGIDTLFYCEEEEMILFGESKFHENISKGIKSINISLSEYEKQIEDEFILVLSNFDTYPNMRGISKYKDKIEMSFTFKEFMQEANITKIGVPIFVMHSGEIRITDILGELDSIAKRELFDLPTTYYLISLPIVSKLMFQRKFVEIIKLKEESYANFRE